jgi:hypothetical protein
MTENGAEILPFALARRWVVTVHCERELVRVRHRRLWYAMARRVGHEERRYHCRTRADALKMAEWLREWIAREEFAEWAQAMLDRLPPIARERVMSRIWDLAEEDA